ncbi:uncharacterized protein LOC122055185 [Zingiber officinale]|uniref:uncharacterized protein LOC122055185 n=1 Tax=Zingiber officinale TaxID=94328 RepID=UPI001C4CBD97|nr:uncharacterized protein LOC122055185 [Zingiber officinale]
MGIPMVSSETMMHAFTQGLTDDDFFRSLIQKPPRDYDHMIKKASEYINVEEAQAARRKEAPIEPIASIERRQPVNHQPPRGPQTEGIRPHQEAMPHVVQHVASERPKPKGKVWTLIFCSFHQSASHNTRDCRGFAPGVQSVQRNYRRRSPSPGQWRPDAGQRTIRRLPDRKHHRSPRSGDRPRASHERARPSAQEEENKSNTARGEINFIVRGPTDGDSNRARMSHARPLEIHGIGCSQEKASGPEINFGPRDLEGVKVPHDDALIIRVVIVNYTIHRIFIDTGSSVNILFKKVFDQLQIDHAGLLPMTTPLYGFTDNEVQQLDQIKLAVSLGEEPLRRTRVTNFIIVEALSAYNVILGRPTLNEFRTVISTFCQKIKFRVEDRVGEVKGDRLRPHESR